MSPIDPQANVTPPLDDFLREYEADDNLWWVIDCGHHQNLFDAAVERMEAAEKLLRCLIIPESVPAVGTPAAMNPETVFAALFDDLDHGSCPGSKIRSGGEEIWLHTTEDVRNWLRGFQDELFGAGAMSPE